MELPTENYKLLTDIKLVDKQGLAMVDVDCHVPVNIEYHITNIFGVMPSATMTSNLLNFIRMTFF